MVTEMKSDCLEEIDQAGDAAGLSRIEDGAQKERSKSGWRYGVAWVDGGLLLAAALVLIPVYWRSGLPFSMDLCTLAGAYWASTAADSIFWAVVLCLIGFPVKETVSPFIGRMRQNPKFVGIVVVLAACLMSILGWSMGLVITVDALAVAELMCRRKEKFGSAVMDAMVPAAYLFGVILVAYAFNHALAGIRYACTYDAMFARMDADLLGFNTSQLARWADVHLPRWVFAVMQFAYFGLYGRIGAALILTAVLGSRIAGMKLVRAMFIGYLVALLVFAVLPVKGPYANHRPDPAARTQSLTVFESQTALVDRVTRLWEHRLDANARSINLMDYYIGFPSMHAALPLIALWSLRRWRNLAICLLAFHVVVVLPSTILLEWHYLFDMLGGVLTAVLAVWAAEQVELLLERHGAVKVTATVPCEA